MEERQLYRSSTFVSSIVYNNTLKCKNYQHEQPLHNMKTLLFSNLVICEAKLFVLGVACCSIKKIYIYILSVIVCVKTHIPKVF